MVTPREQQRKRRQDEQLRQREDHKAYADRVIAERKADGEEKRQARDAEQRAAVESRLRRKYLAHGMNEAEFESKKAELLAAEMQRQAEQQADATTAQARRRVARAGF